jgi:hypothetical protein
MASDRYYFNSEELRYLRGIRELEALDDSYITPHDAHR